MSQGKAYHNRKPKVERKANDGYSTPRSLVWELHKQYPGVIDSCDILEPCCGRDQNIMNALGDIGISCTGFDLYYGQNRQDIFAYDGEHDMILTNVPFTNWDDFIFACKSIARRVVVIGRTNYFGTYQRYDSGIWKGLRQTLVFNRMVDYETPARKDGHFHVGGLVTAWMVFDRDYRGKAYLDHVDVQKYATLGQYPRKICKECGKKITKGDLCKKCVIKIQDVFYGRV
jgi:hypothetical protein